MNMKSSIGTVSIGASSNNIHDNDDEEMMITSTLDEEEEEQQQPSRWIVISRYVLLATIAVTLTLTCPGHTKLWIETTTNSSIDKNTSSNDRILLLNRILVMEVLVIYVMIITGFIIVHFSNPGFLTKEIMNEIQQQDYENNNIENTIDTGTDIDIMDEYEQQQQFLLTTTTTNMNMNHDDNDIKDHRRIMIEMTDLTVKDKNSNGIDSNVDPLTVRYDNECFDDTSNDTHPSLTKYSTITRRTKYCTTCNIQPLIRSHHCKVCHCCIATFDHHCYFLGVCIGERNRTKFYYFLLLQAIGFYICCIHIVASSQYGWTTLLFPTTHTTSINHNDNNNNMIIYDSIRVIIAKLFLYPLTIIAWIMLGVHTFFMITNITTFECAKGSKHIDYLHHIHDIMDLPFHFGFMNNIKLYCINDDICYYNHCCSSHIGHDQWKPTVWKKPGHIIRDSPDWWNHPWRNKYWSCC